MVSYSSISLLNAIWADTDHPIFFFSYRDSVTILSWLLLLLLDARRRGSKIQMFNTDNLLPH
jgi:hypothetical protein